VKPINKPARTIRVGIVGCGKISDAYFTGCRRYPILELVACADLNAAVAEAKASEHGLRAESVDALLAAPDIDLVINLTIPQAHAPLNERVLRAGKHVYVEKPFALDPASGTPVLALADELGLRVGCAPDTFLGGGLQTARQLLDSGAIGSPVAALALMLCPGHESWHPSPSFYYEAGGGPMFDMGPYYITALINFLGPVRRVSGVARKSFEQRIIRSQPLAGQIIPVKVPTHYTRSMEFASGAVATIVMSFDIRSGPEIPRIMLYGSEGTLEVPDPNTFGGQVRLRDLSGPSLRDIPLTHTDDRARGSGVADLAYTLLRPDRGFRCTGRLAQHVLEIMVSFDRSSVEGRHIEIRSTCDRPTALPANLPPDRFET